MKKLVSILLTLTMILGIFSIIPISAHAQTIDPDKVYVKTGGQYYEAEKGQIFTYQHLISVDNSRRISGFDVNVYYDTEGLDFVPYLDAYGDDDVERHFPTTTKGLLHNFNFDGDIIYTCSNYKGAIFDENSVLFKGQFEVTADSGVYEIDSVIKNLADVELAPLVYNGLKYDDFDEKEVIVDLNIAQGVTDEPTQDPMKDMITVYLVDSLRWNGSMTMFAHAYSGTKGQDDYVENAPNMGKAMAKTNRKTADGAVVYKVYLDQDYENIRFALGYHPSTITTDVRPDMYFDNATNQWYEKLEDIPEYIPTEAVEETQAPQVPTVPPVTEKPEQEETQKPTEKEENKYEDIDGLYVVADGVFYEVEKGQKFTYQYIVNVDKTREISTFETSMFYDTEGLDFVPYTDEYGDVEFLRHFPKTPNGLVYNFNIDGEIYYNIATLNSVILDNCVLFEGQFEVTADSGVYEIDTRMMTLGDFDMCAIVYQGEVYDTFEDSQIITDLNVAEDIVLPTQEIKEKITVYFVDSVNTDTSIKRAAMYAHAIKGEPDGDDYKENAKAPGQYMVKVALTSPDGAYVRKVYLDEGYDRVSFGYSKSYPARPSTEYVEIKDGWFFDNGTNQWYENLEDIPAYVPTEPPTVTPTQKPTVVETERPSETEKAPTPDLSDGVYVVVDGVTYAVDKGDVFEYCYYISLDSSIKISSLDVHMTYDKKGLDFVPTLDEYGDVDIYAHFPRICNGVVYNFGIGARIYYNYSNVTGVRLTDDTAVFKGAFKVTADSGVYKIDSRIITLADKDMNRIVTEGEVIQDIFTERVELSNSAVGEGDVVYPTQGGDIRPSTEPEESSQAPEAPGVSDDDMVDPETPTEGYTEPLEGHKLGDVNRDGKINVFDVTAIQRYAALYVEFDEEQLALADTNFDSKVNIFDATEIQRFVAGQITKFEKK